MVPAEGQVGTVGAMSPALLHYPTLPHPSMVEWGWAGAEGLTLPLTARAASARGINLATILQPLVMKSGCLGQRKVPSTASLPLASFVETYGTFFLRVAGKGYPSCPDLHTVG